MRCQRRAREPPSVGALSSSPGDAQVVIESVSQFWLSEVEVPFAVNAAGEVVAYEATLTKPAPPYKCSGCERPVVTRARSTRARGHFAHNPDGPGGGGGACEGYDHRTAVLLVERRWRELKIHHACVECGPGRLIPLPDAVEARREQVVHGDDGYARADVLLRNSAGVAVFALEIVDTHGVELPALAAYQQRSVPCVELRASHLLRAFGSTDAVQVQTIRATPPPDCPICRQAMRNEQARYLRALAKRVEDAEISDAEERAIEALRQAPTIARR